MGNTLIRSFMELRYFTKVSVLTTNFGTAPQGAFQRCTNLERIDLTNIVTINSNPSNNVFGGTALTEIVLPNITSLPTYIGKDMSRLKKIDVGEKCTSVPQYFANFNSNAVFIFRSTTPPSLASSSNSYSHLFYVPDESVEAYKTATNWSNMASRIKPISEYTE